MQQATSQRVINVIAEVAGCSPEAILINHSLREQLGCDSLDIVEIMMALENEFHIEIDEYKFEKLATVQDVLYYVAGVCTEFQTACLQRITQLQPQHREHQIAVLKKCALDAAMELDWLKNQADITEEKRDALAQIVERTHDAVSQLATEEERRADAAASDGPEAERIAA